MGAAGAPAAYRRPRARPARPHGASPRCSASGRPGRARCASRPGARGAVPRPGDDEPAGRPDPDREPSQTATLACSDLGTPVPARAFAGMSRALPALAAVVLALALPAARGGRSAVDAAAERLLAAASSPARCSGRPPRATAARWRSGRAGHDQPRLRWRVASRAPGAPTFGPQQTAPDDLVDVVGYGNSRTVAGVPAADRPAGDAAHEDPGPLRAHDRLLRQRQDHRRRAVPPAQHDGRRERERRRRGRVVRRPRHDQRPRVRRACGARAAASDRRSSSPRAGSARSTSPSGPRARCSSRGTRAARSAPASGAR